MERIYPIDPDPVVRAVEGGSVGLRFGGGRNHDVVSRIVLHLACGCPRTLVVWIHPHQGCGRLGGGLEDHLFIRVRRPPAQGDVLIHDHIPARAQTDAGLWVFSAFLQELRRQLTEGGRVQPVERQPAAASPPQVPPRCCDVCFFAATHVETLAMPVELRRSSCPPEW